MVIVVKRRLVAIILMLLICALAILSSYYLTSNRSMDPNGTTLEKKEKPSDEKEHTEGNIIEKTTSATILATGDIMFHMPQINAAYDDKNKTYDFTDNFKYVKKYIESADLSIGNFETVVAGDEIKFSGFPMFNAPKETLAAIKESGFDILSTVNNHSLDQGKEGLINTIDSIEEYGMKNIGTYKEPSSTVFIEKVNEIDVALLSYSYGFNGMDHTLTEEELSYMVNTIDEEKIKRDIEKAKELDADIVVVFIHWGNEYQREPSEYQVELGRKMVEWGANIIFGSHPHVIQKAEMINHNGKDNFIIYSMGNFLSNQRREILNNKYTEDGIMVEVKIEKDFLKGETIIKDINYIPTWVRKYHDAYGVQYEILPVEDFLEDDELRAKIDQDVEMRIKESYRETMDKMAQFY